MYYRFFLHQCNIFTILLCNIRTFFTYHTTKFLNSVVKCPANPIFACHVQNDKIMDRLIICYNNNGAVEKIYLILINWENSIRTYEK